MLKKCNRYRLLRLRYITLWGEIVKRYGAIHEQRRGVLKRLKMRYALALKASANPVSIGCFSMTGNIL